MARKKALFAAEEESSSSQQAREVADNHPENALLEAAGDLDATMMKLELRLKEARSLYMETQAEEDTMEACHTEELAKLDKQIERQCSGNAQLRGELDRVRGELSLAEESEAWEALQRLDEVQRSEDELLLLRVELSEATSRQRRVRARLVQSVLDAPYEFQGEVEHDAGSTQQEEEEEEEDTSRPQAVPLAPLPRSGGERTVSKPKFTEAMDHPKSQQSPKGITSRIAAARLAQRSAEAAVA